MFNHIVVGSNDIPRSQAFYNAVLSVLGVGDGVRDVAESGHVRVFYRHAGMGFCVSQPIDDRHATPANGGTVAFRCISAGQVIAFHEAAVANGGTSIEDPPGPRSSSAGVVHLAYVRDPDGNKLCAIHRP